MAENSLIEWTDHTFNPWIGCTAVSPGCDHCYAEALATRRLGVAWGPHAERRRTAPSTWALPLRWNRQAEREGRRFRVFCASLADVFDNQVPPEWREDLWYLISQTQSLDWLLLTKRPQNILKMGPGAGMGICEAHRRDLWDGGWPNVWLGTTVENQEEADRRIPHLLAVPAAVRFLSCEPLLGALDLRYVTVKVPGEPWRHYVDALTGEVHDDANGTIAGAYEPGQAPTIDWVIAGGESGPKARPMHPDWTRSLRDQCAAAGVPFFLKQWGEWAPALDGDRAVSAEGRNLPNLEPHGRNGDGAVRISRIGKKSAGAMLDGRLHRAFPEVHRDG